jgi:hypothetical protein
MRIGRMLKGGGVLMVLLSGALLASSAPAERHGPYASALSRTAVSTAQPRSRGCQHRRCVGINGQPRCVIWPFENCSFTSPPPPQPRLCVVDDLCD